MGEDRRYGKRPRLCENDGEAWSTSSDGSGDDPSIPLDGSWIPDDGTATRENDTAACASAGSSPFFCDFCKVPLASFDLSCQHLSVHLREERRREEPTAAFEPIALGQQPQPEGTVYLAEPADTPCGRIGSRFPASSNASPDDGAIPSTTPTETGEATQASLSARIPEDAIAAQDQDTAACASTDSSPFFCEFCKAHLASFHLVCEHFSVHLLEERTREEHTAILEAIALRLQRQREGTEQTDDPYERIGSPVPPSSTRSADDGAIPSTSCTELQQTQVSLNARDSENIYEDEETAELFQIAFSPSIYGDPDETSNETIDFQKYATFNTIADEAVQSTTPQDVTNIELPDVPRLAHRDVRSNKAAGYSGNTLGKEEGQHQGSVQPDVDSVQQASGQRLYTSEMCKESFTRANHLQEHHRTHTNDRPYRCEICGRSFKTSSAFTKHRHTPTNDRPYRCELCGASFKRKDILENHHRTHTNDRPYLCELCGASFKTKGGLSDHRRTHKNHRPCLCELCGKSFKTNNVLKRHRRTHTDDKGHACPICGKSFKTEECRAAHHRTHRGEKRYPCDICNKSYTKKSNLKVHRRRHTGEKPYTCNICGKSFARKTTFIIHHRTHTGEKPYSCEICKKSFATKAQLAKHRCINKGEKN